MGEQTKGPPSLRTAELRSDQIAQVLSQKRAMADVLVTMCDRAWRHGWIVGFATGAAVAFIVLGLWKILTG